MQSDGQTLKCVSVGMHQTLAANFNRYLVLLLSVQAYL